MSTDYPYTRNEAMHKMVAGKLMQARWQIEKEHYLYDSSQVAPFLCIDRQGKIFDDKIATDCEEWRIYKEPKKIVESWLWVVQYSDTLFPELDKYFYANEAQAIAGRSSDVTLVCRADWSRIEVPE